jgi:hypothetical protein
MTDQSTPEDLSVLIQKFFTERDLPLSEGSVQSELRHLTAHIAEADQQGIPEWEAIDDWFMRTAISIDALFAAR